MLLTEGDRFASIEPLFETNKIIDEGFEDRVHPMSKMLTLQFMMLLGQLLFESNKNLHRVELHSSVESPDRLHSCRCKIYLDQIKIT